MRLPDEQDERGFSAPVMYTIVTVSVLVLIILAIVYSSNHKKSGNRNLSNAVATASPVASPDTESPIFADGDKDIESLYKENKLRAEDLDFWDMYEREDAVVLETPAVTPSPTATPELTDEQKALDGKHLQVTYKDGTQEWIEIDDNLPLHEYDFTKLKAEKNQMIYYEGNKKISRLGIVISKDSGNIDFEQIKAGGVDFVMLTVGARGYETGLITPDTSFEDFALKAKEAGLHLGIIFYSQAVTIEEAAEEAAFVAGMLRPYEIEYPVAVCMETIMHDIPRTDILDKEKKTQIIETFLSDIEQEGYSPILYGSRDFLLTEIIPEGLLADYEVWLTDQKPVPDYPYDFKMWEYTEGENLFGVEEEVSYTISFVDYTKR